MVLMVISPTAWLPSIVCCVAYLRQFYWAIASITIGRNNL